MFIIGVIKLKIVIWTPILILTLIFIVIHSTNIDVDINFTLRYLSFYYALMIDFIW